MKLLNFLSQQLKMEERFCVTVHVPILFTVDLFKVRELSVCTLYIVHCKSTVQNRTKNKMCLFTL
jgi:hypothetical protein